MKKPKSAEHQVGGGHDAQYVLWRAVTATAKTAPAVILLLIVLHVKNGGRVDPSFLGYLLAVTGGLFLFMAVGAVAALRRLRRQSG